jgi:hypothetical protein
VRKRREIEQASHTFRDPGEPIKEADYRPRISGNPEQTLATAFILMKRDYGGPLAGGFCVAARADWREPS